MPRRPIRVVPAAALASGFDQIRHEAGVRTDFPADAVAEAGAAGERRAAGRERVDLPFATIDPPGARDLDQAMQIERRGDGHRIRYAIADVAAFVEAEGPIDRESHARGVTVYAPDAKAPLHPPSLSEGAASLLPGEWRPAVLWTLDLDGDGELGAHRRVQGRGPQRRAAHLCRRAPRARRTAGRGRGAAARARALPRRRAARRPRAGGRRGGRLAGPSTTACRWRPRSTTPRSRCSPGSPLRD